MHSEMSIVIRGPVVVNDDLMSEQYVGLKQLTDCSIFRLSFYMLVTLYVWIKYAKKLIDNVQ